MPVLSNQRHERFAQGIAAGLSAEDAYRTAGYAPDRKNAHRLTTNDGVKARVEELLSRGAARAEVTVERVVRELAKIGFSDVRKIVEWTGSEIQDEDEGEDGQPRVVVRAANIVRLIGSEDVDDDTAAAIAEISQSKEGALKVKLHDKRAALVDLGKHLGMFVERQETTLNGALTIARVERVIVDPADPDAA